MDKKIYIQPQTEITKAVLTQMLAGSVIGNVGDDTGTIGYGGSDDDGTMDPGVKGEAWTDIWE